MAVNIVEQIDNDVEINRVLISVSNKDGLDRFVPELMAVVPKIKIYSTGGTYQALQDIIGRKSEGTLVQVSEYTGQPEMQGGLVKTLDFRIYLGLLSETYNSAHASDLERTRAVPIDMVVANLYPFESTIRDPKATVEHARANIDIGGPCMIRAAAKNFLRVASVTRPDDYAGIIAEMDLRGGRLCLQTRFRLATKAFAHTADYDRTIADYFVERSFEEARSCYRIMSKE